MITLYSGTPGSGKSYHACAHIVHILTHCVKGVISNFPLNLKGYRVKSGCRITYWDNSDITTQRLVAYAKTYHTLGVEGQTLLVVDEAQVVWNARQFQGCDRMDWIKFFSQHRKLGYDILMIAQNDRMIDRQIRMLIEYEVKHRKINNYGFGGTLIGLFRTGFIALRYWYGGNKLLLGREWVWYNRKIAGIYDTMRMFDDVALSADFAGLLLLMDDDSTKVISSCHFAALQHLLCVLAKIKVFLSHRRADPDYEMKNARSLLVETLQKLLILRLSDSGLDG